MPAAPPPSFPFAFRASRTASPQPAPRPRPAAGGRSRRLRTATIALGLAAVGSVAACTGPLTDEAEADPAGTGAVVARRHSVGLKQIPMADNGTPATSAVDPAAVRATGVAPAD